MLILAAVSIIDRAGVPTALVTGILAINGSPSEVAVFLGACILGSLVGDLGCFGLGIFLRRRGDRAPLSFRGPSSLHGKVSRAAQFIDKHPRLWQIGGRAFPLVNQLIPMAAGIRGRSIVEAVWTNLLGGVCWLSAWAILTQRYARAAEDWPVMLRWGLAVVGVTVLGLAIRRASSSVSRG